MCEPSIAPTTLDNPDSLRNLAFVFNKLSPVGQDITSIDMEFNAFITLLTECESEDFPKSNFVPIDLK